MTFPFCCGVFLEDDVVWVVILDVKDMILGNGLNAFIVVFWKVSSIIERHLNVAIRIAN